MRFAAAAFVFVLACSSGAIWPAFAVSEDRLVPLEKREEAPGLSLRDLEGQRRQLSHLAGKVVVVNFWATWCGPCRAEMGEFTKVYTDYRERGVEFVGAANEPRSAKDAVREFVRRHEIRFPVWLEASLDHMEAFGVAPGLPATVIVDPRGRIAARIKGVTDASQLRTLLDRILTEPAPSPARSGGR